MIWHTSERTFWDTACGAYTTEGTSTSIRFKRGEIRIEHADDSPAYFFWLDEYGCQPLWTAIKRQLLSLLWNTYAGPLLWRITRRITDICSSA